MPDDHAAASGVDEHARRNLAGERAFALPVQILRGDADGAAARGFHCRSERGEGRGDHDVAMRCGGDERQERFEERARFRARLVHLPIAGDHGAAQSLSLGASGFIGERFDAGQFFAGEKFERCAAAG